jgi:hypothetical protein
VFHDPRMLQHFPKARSPSRVELQHLTTQIAAA